MSAEIIVFFVIFLSVQCALAPELYLYENRMGYIIVV